MSLWVSAEIIIVCNLELVKVINQTRNVLIQSCYIVGQAFHTAFFDPGNTGRKLDSLVGIIAAY